MIFVILFLVFTGALLLTYFGVPFFIATYVELSKKRAQKFASDMDRSMLDADIKRVVPLYFIGPLVFGVGGFLLAPAPFKLMGAAAGAFVGYVAPRYYAGMLITRRRDQFNDQLVDGLMIMSSSFRGGLSLIQSMEAVAEEMPNPIRQEFSIVLGENKMGVTMDEAMNRLYKRVPSPAMQQMISAILLARETGGNLPIIFARIVETIRARKKIEENIAVLTLQGKIQALVMSGLPVGFFFMVSSSNPDYFKTMMDADIGRILLMACLGLWLVGTFLILKISSFRDF